MIDFGFDKIALIGAVALIVIGPERLPRVARTVGHLLGKAQRYVSDVKAEVSRSIELEELKKAKGQFEDAARGMQESVSNEIHQVSQSLSTAWNDPASDNAAIDGFQFNSYHHKPKKKNWRLKRSAMPQWYKQRHGVRSKAQSGAARVARFRPPRPNP
jgi:sec-independent protein translocase protein TatB